MRCEGIPVVDGLRPVIKHSELDTFYCSAFTRRNSAKPISPISIPIEYERDVDGEIVGYKDSANKNTQNTQPEEEQKSLPPIQRRFV